MLKAVKFPASIADLNTSLTDVDRNTLVSGEGDDVVPFSVFLFLIFNNRFLFSLNYEKIK